MQVKVKVIGNAWGLLGLLWHKGKVANVDEKQAELGEQLGVFEILERYERPSIPDTVTANKATKPKSVR